MTRYTHLLLISIVSLLPLLAVAETSFVTVENRSGQRIKVAIPGAKPVRLEADAAPLRVELETSLPNGVEAKAWWVSKPRELCVIFVRYEGQVVVAGKKKIRCLGH